MNKHLAKDLERYADMLAEGELVSPDDLNCSAVMRLAAEALAQPEQEPVAWANSEGGVVWAYEDVGGTPNWTDYYTIPLYTTPPKRTWVGLTPDEIRGISLASGESLFSAIMFTHDKLKEKNT